MPNVQIFFNRVKKQWKQKKKDITLYRGCKNGDFWPVTMHQHSSKRTKESWPLSKKGSKEEKIILPQKKEL